MAEGSGVDGSMLAKLFDCDERTIRNLAAKGVVIRQGRGRYAFIPSVQGYVRHLREQAAGRLGDTEKADVVLENALLKRSQREYTDLRKALLAGTVVRVDEIGEGWTRIVRAVRSGVLSATGKIRFALPHLTVFDEEEIDRILRQALEDAALGDKPPSIDGAADDESELPGGGNGGTPGPDGADDIDAP